MVNNSAIVVNFVTSDGGSRDGCIAEAELVGASAISRFDGFSTRYTDVGSGRALSYHHVTLHSLAERTEYKYRVRVSNRSSSPGHGKNINWTKTTGIKWCSGANLAVGDVFKQGLDSGDDWCPFLPGGLSHDAEVGLCESVCANATACAGFTFYPGTPKIKTVCCFRTVTSSKPPDPTSDAECYERQISPRCASDPSAWSDWLDFRSLYSSGRTKLALYGDMGVFVSEGEYTPPVRGLPAPARHNIGNLVDDLAAGLIDFVVHR